MKHCIVFFCVFFCFFSGFFQEPALAEDKVAGDLRQMDSHLLETLSEALIRNPKALATEALVADFLAGESETRIIVTLRNPDKNAVSANLDQKAAQRIRASEMESIEQAVIGSLNPDAVKRVRGFKYFPGFSAKVTLEGLQALLDHSEVLSIQKDRTIYPNLAQGIPLMNASQVRTSYSGQGISAAICDTGIDYTHPSLGGAGFPNSKVIGGYDFGDDDTDPMDYYGHGTACAGIVAGSLGTVGDYVGGVAYSAKLYALKITSGSSGSAYDSDVISAWEWCITHQYDDPGNPILVVNLSFGGGRYLSQCDASHPAYVAAAQNLISAGISLFVSAGNEGYCDSLASPSCISSAISVGAVYDAYLGTNPPAGWVGCIKNGSCVGIPGPPCDEKYYVDDPAGADQVATYSNSALFLDILAPSNWATTTKLGGSYWNTANGFGGTSAASPYAAGAAAALQSAAMALNGAFLSPDQVRSTFENTGASILDAKSGIAKPRVNLGEAVLSIHGGGETVYVEPGGTCGGKTPCYTSIQAAVNAVTSSSVIKVAQGFFNERLLLNSNKKVSLEGGWDTSFSVKTGNTNADSLSVSKGTLNIDRMVLY